MQSNSPFPTFLLLLIGVIVLCLNSHVSDVSEKKRLTSQEKIEIAPPAYHLFISYEVELETLYAGAVNYIPYKASQKIEVTERQFNEPGLPAQTWKWGPASMVISFDRLNGDTCELLIPVNGMWQWDNPRRYGAISCAGSFFYMKILAQRKGTEIKVWASPILESEEQKKPWA